MTRKEKPAKFLFIATVKINNQITAAELRVLDNQSNNLGVMSKDAALSLAKEKGLDLIEISPSAKPPVAKIISFDKYRYQQEKKIKQQRAQQKIQGLKQIQISVGEAKHDLDRKAQRANEFMADGNQVEILMVLRGRQKAHKDFAREKLNAFLKMVNPEHKIIMAPRPAARGIAIQIAKK